MGSAAPLSSLLSSAEDEAPLPPLRRRCVSVVRRVSSCRYDENSRPRCLPLPPPRGPALGIVVAR